MGGGGRRAPGAEARRLRHRVRPRGGPAGGADRGHALLHAPRTGHEGPHRPVVRSVRARGGAVGAVHGAAALRRWIADRDPRGRPARPAAAVRAPLRGPRRARRLARAAAGARSAAALPARGDRGARSAGARSSAPCPADLVAGPRAHGPPPAAAGGGARAAAAAGDRGRGPRGGARAAVGGPRGGDRRGRGAVRRDPGGIGDRQDAARAVAGRARSDAGRCRRRRGGWIHHRAAEGAAGRAVAAVGGVRGSRRSDRLSPRRSCARGRDRAGAGPARRAPDALGHGPVGPGGGPAGWRASTRG